MQKINIFFILFIIVFVGNNLFAQPNWPAVKSSTMPTVSIPEEYATPYKQPLSNGGWEDGIFITRDGLNLYCIYAPLDLLSYTLFDSADNTNFAPFLRGPTFGMDLTTNPIGASAWLQADILYSHRNTITDSFSVWQLSNLANPVFSEGAPQINSNTSTVVDLFVYTTNNHPPGYKPDIVLLRNVGLNPSVQGTVLPAPITTQYKEDNPHIERLDSLNLVLFFDSDDRPGGVGQLDIWYSTSADNGASWTTPLQVSTLNTTNGEQQPHLYKDNNSDWYIYYTGTNTVTWKLEIYRAKQGIIGNWDSWINKESIIGAGNAAGVGEPTLTQNGDISFVVVYSDTVNGTTTNRFDADPWFLPKIDLPLSINSSLQNTISSIHIYPNPATKTLTIKFSSINIKDQAQIYNSNGEVIKEFEIIHSSEINIGGLPKGLYFIKLKNNPQLNTKFIKQ